MADEKCLIVSTWSSGRGFSWDPKTLPVLRLPVPTSIFSAPVDFDPEIATSGEPDVVDFFVVKHSFNGEMVPMVHGRLRGIEVNVSLDPPQIV